MTMAKGSESADMTNTRDRVGISVKTIDDMTDDLLEIADVLEEHSVNVMHEGRWLNPVSAIRSKVSIIWDDVLMLADEARKAVDEVKADDRER